MKFGMNMLLWTTHVTERHLPEIELLKRLGYDLVEIPMFRYDPDHYARLGEAIRAIGLEPLALTSRSREDNPISPDPAMRAHAVETGKLAIDCAVALGSPILTGPFHSTFGIFTGRGPTAEEWAWGVEGMRALGGYAAGQGITLGLEFLNRFECYLLNTASDSSRFCADVGLDNVGTLYDTHHANIEEFDVGAAIRDNAARINHVHISENNRGTPGTGQVHWAATFDALHEIGYAGRLVVEAFALDLPELTPIVKVWRPLFESEEQLARDALAFMRREWSKRGR
jgi:D-psicose/D-tagatose/L-ribulose 3-epimerase